MGPSDSYQYQYYLSCKPPDDLRFWPIPDDSRTETKSHRRKSLPWSIIKVEQKPSMFMGQLYTTFWSPLQTNIRINEPCSKPFLDLNAISRPYACTLRNTYAIHLMCYHRKKSHKTNTSWDLFWESHGTPTWKALRHNSKWWWWSTPKATSLWDERDLMPWGFFRGIYILKYP